MTVQAPGRLVSIIVAFVKDCRVSNKQRKVSLNGTFFGNSSSPSMINRSPSPSDWIRCFARSFAQLDPIGNPRHSQFCMNSGFTFRFPSCRVDSIACHSVLRHGMEMEYFMPTNSLLLNRRAVLFSTNVLPHPGFPMRHQISGFVILYSFNLLVKSPGSIFTSLLAIFLR